MNEEDKNSVFEIFGTAHNWIKVVDFLSKPKMKLIDTIDLEKDGVSKDIFKPVLTEESQSAFNYMLINAKVDDLIFGLLRENEELIEEYDYVVPSYIHYYGEYFVLTIDCFKRA